MDGHFAALIGPATGRGVEPAKETLQSPMVAPRSEEKISSRLSAVHVGGPIIGRLSKVRRFGWPPVIGITKRSLLTPATVERTNAIRVPSGKRRARDRTMREEVR